MRVSCANNDWCTVKKPEILERVKKLEIQKEKLFRIQAKILKRLVVTWSPAVIRQYFKHKKKKV